MCLREWSVALAAELAVRVNQPVHCLEQSSLPWPPHQFAFARRGKLTDGFRTVRRGERQVSDAEHVQILIVVTDGCNGIGFKSQIFLGP